MSAIVAASPVVIIPVLTNPSLALSLPATLVTALHARHAELVADHERMRIPAPTFDAWLEFQLTTVAYGDGHPWPEERR